MSMTPREQRGFLNENPEEQFQDAHVKFFRLALSAKTLEDSLYYWTLVYSKEKRGPRWSGHNPPANIVRQMLTKEHGDMYYFTNKKLDEILYTNNKDLHHEVDRQERKNDTKRWYITVENRHPQLNDLSPEAVFMLKSILLDILALCDYEEKRLFAFILVKNELDSFLELFEDKTILGEFNVIIEELYKLIDEKESNKQEQRNIPTRGIGKREFVLNGVSSFRQYRNIEKGFLKKIRPLFQFIEKDPY